MKRIYLSSLEEKVIEILKSNVIPATAEELGDTAEKLNVKIQKTSIPATLSVLTTKKKLVKRSRKMNARTCIYRLADCPCPEGHIDLGFERVMSKYTKVSGKTSWDPELPSPKVGQETQVKTEWSGKDIVATFNVIQAKEVYDELKRIFN